MLGAELAQAGRAGFLAHLDQPFGVEAELAALGEHGRLRRDVDGVLALVVDHAAAVIAAILFGHRPGRKAGMPSGLEPANNIAMAIAEDGRERGVLDTLSVEERAFSERLRQRLAGEAMLFQCGCDFA